MTEKTTIDDLIFEIECMAPAGETNGIPYLRLGKADLLHKLNAIKGQSDHQPDLNIKNNNNNPTPWSQIMTDHQQTFAVGEYYSTTYYSKGYKTNATFIFKVLEINGGIIKVLELDTYLNTLKEGAFNLDSTFAKECTPATAEQIKMFKVVEAIEKSGLTLEQHKKMISDGKINIGVWSALQTTAEELQEVESNE